MTISGFDRESTIFIQEFFHLNARVAKGIRGCVTILYLGCCLLQDTDYLPVTVLIEDINDNRPEFVGAPYRIRVEELTPPGLTIFRGLQALDRDKPNTANSEVTYSIIGGNEERKFSVEATSSKKAVIVLRKDLDYDSEDKLFNLTIKAEVSLFM